MRIIVSAVAAVLLLSDAVNAAELVVRVPGIPGPYCAYGAEKRLLELSGVREVRTSWQDEQIVIVTSDSAHVMPEDIRQALIRADYPYKFEIRTAAE